MFNAQDRIQKYVEMELLRRKVAEDAVLRYALQNGCSEITIKWPSDASLFAYGDSGITWLLPTRRRKVRKILREIEQNT